MAESLIVHFATATQRDVSDWLNRISARTKGNWAFPSNGEYLVLAYEYNDYLSEFEPDDLERLCRLLGGLPTVGLCLEIRRSKGRAAHDHAVELAKKLLSDFAGVVQDIRGEEYWSLSDLVDGAAERSA